MKLIGRLLRVALVLAILAGGLFVAGWLGANPGSATVFWRGTRYDLSVTGVAVIGFALVVAVAVLTWLLLLIIRGPKRLRAWRSRRAHDKALTMLSRGLTAVAAGDTGAAKAAANRIGALDPDLPLGLLLKAQAAQLAHDRSEAASAFAAMIRHPETEFLGLRGMLLLASRGEAPPGTDTLALAERAHALKPGARWTADALFDLKARAGAFDQAEQIVQQAVKKHALTAAEGRRKRAVLWDRKSREAEARENNDDALTFARRAAELAPEFAPTAVRLAGLEAKRGGERRARQTLERALGKAPHPELVAAYAALGGPDETLLKRVERMEGLLKHVPKAAPQSAGYIHIGIADAALNAELWGVARRHLEEAQKLFAADAPAGLYRRFARLEAAEHRDRQAEFEWTRKAHEARADEAWTCRACGTPAPAWEDRCPACGTFDGLEWRSPARIAQSAIGGADTSPGSPLR